MNVLCRSDGGTTDAGLGALLSRTTMVPAAMSPSRRPVASAAIPPTR